MNRFQCYVIIIIYMITYSLILIWLNYNNNTIPPTHELVPECYESDYKEYEYDKFECSHETPIVNYCVKGRLFTLYCEPPVYTYVAQKIFTVPSYMKRYLDESEPEPGSK